MPEKQPKPKSAIELKTDKLKAQKAVVAQTYKKFGEYHKRYGSVDKLADTFKKEDVDIKALAKDPKYKGVFENIVSLSQQGLGSLLLLKGFRISKGMNLLILKRKLRGFKARLKTTLSEWKKTNTKLEGLVAVEKKRSGLFVKLNENAGGYVLNEGIRHPAYIRAAVEVEDNPQYDALLTKIKNASPDEINAMYRDAELFKPILEYTKKVIKAENARWDMITDLINEPEAISHIGIPTLKTEKQKQFAEYAIINSYAFNKLKKIISDSTPDQILQHAKIKNPFRKYWEEFQVIGYQCANEEQLENSVKPYLKLKPKGVTEGQFLAALKNSTHYKKAFNVIKNGGLAEQKAFKPESYINFNAEAAIQLAKANGSDTLYKYARLVAENMKKKKGKIVGNDFDLA